VPRAVVASGNVNECAMLTLAAACGVLSIDVAGAAAFAICALSLHDALPIFDTTTAVTTGVDQAIAGAHGTLTLHADGGYSYQSTANNIAADATDTVVYTIRDGDGDLATTTLTINLADVTLAADNQAQTVDEA